MAPRLIAAVGQAERVRDDGGVVAVHLDRLLGDLVAEALLRHAERRPVVHLARAVRLEGEPFGMRLAEADVVVVEPVLPAVLAVVRRLVARHRDGVVEAVPLPEGAVLEVVDRGLSRALRGLERVRAEDARVVDAALVDGVVVAHPADLQARHEVERETVRHGDLGALRNHLARLAGPEVAAAERLEEVGERVAEALRVGSLDEHDAAFDAHDRPLGRPLAVLDGERRPAVRRKVARNVHLAADHLLQMVAELVHRLLQDRPVLGDDHGVLHARAEEPQPVARGRAGTERRLHGHLVVELQVASRAERFEEPAVLLRHDEPLRLRLRRVFVGDRVPLGISLGNQLLRCGGGRLGPQRRENGKSRVDSRFHGHIIANFGVMRRA